MSIRIVKASVAFNITLKASIDFLKTRKDIVQIERDVSIMMRMSKGQYDTLAKKFS